MFLLKISESLQHLFRKQPLSGDTEQPTTLLPGLQHPAKLLPSSKDTFGGQKTRQKTILPKILS